MPSVLSQSLKSPTISVGKCGGFAEQRMLEQVPDLPVSFALGQAKVPVHQMDGAFRRLDDRHLGTARFPLLQAQRDMVMVADRPAR